MFVTAIHNVPYTVLSHLPVLSGSHVINSFRRSGAICWQRDKGSDKGLLHDDTKPHPNQCWFKIIPVQFHKNDQVMLGKYDLRLNFYSSQWTAMEQ